MTGGLPEPLDLYEPEIELVGADALLTWRLQEV